MGMTDVWRIAKVELAQLWRSRTFVAMAVVQMWRRRGALRRTGEPTQGTPRPSRRTRRAKIPLRR